jgi:hypothetical protein
MKISYFESILGLGLVAGYVLGSALFGADDGSGYVWPFYFQSGFLLLANILALFYIPTDKLVREVIKEE